MSGHSAESGAGPFLDFDGSGDLTIWRDDPERPDFPQPIVRRCDVSAEAWDLLIAGVAAGRALADWDEWNPFHGSYREAASALREQIDQAWVRTCACGKPIEHVEADPDSEAWACLVPAFDRMTTAADAVLATARRICCGENPAPHHAATDAHSQRMAFAEGLARAVRGS